MPLPAGGRDTPWPPTAHQAAYNRYDEWAAWYSGSPQELTRVYAGVATGQDRTGFFDPATTAQPYNAAYRRFLFWARQQPGALTRIRIHCPAAADIAAVSSDMLFSDEPDLLIPDAHVAKAKPGAKAAQQRLDELEDKGSFLSVFSEGGEVASAMGGVYLRVNWDKEFVSDRPLLTTVHPDAAIGEFMWGQLMAVTFWRTVLVDGKTVYRHLERHEPGAVLHGLYKGGQRTLGVPVRLSELPETAPLAGEDKLALQASMPTGVAGLTAAYVPNMRPQRVDRKSELGRSDYSGCEGFMDALDEVWTSWIRDIRLGRARLFAPEEYMTATRRGQGAQFDLEREVWELLKLQPPPPGTPIQAQQFQIRVEEHSSTAEALLERIVATAGYSGSTFGLRNTEAEKTATEVMARERRSLVTRGKKIKYWNRALSDILEVLLQVDAQEFNGKAGKFRPRVDWPPAVHDSMVDRANVINLLKGAKAISQRTTVELLHPEWDPDEVDTELERIADDAKASPPPAITTGNGSPLAIPAEGGAGAAGSPPPGAGPVPAPPGPAQPPTR